MTFKINRLYYLLSRKHLKILLCEILGALLFFLITWFIIYEIPIEMIIGVPCLFVVGNLLYLLHYPSKFTVKSGDVRVHMWLEKSSTPKWGDLRINGFRVSHKPVYAVMQRITKIEITRPIGRLRLYGKAYAQDHWGKPVIDVFAPRQIDLHGVKDLDAVTKELRSAYPKAEVTEWNQWGKSRNEDRR